MMCVGKGMMGRRGGYVVTGSSNCVSSGKSKGHQKSIFCLCALVSACLLGCGGESNDELTCDCATGANCSETEKANCSSQKPCDCETGANCSETEKANCSSQKTCDCATGANCSDEEKANCSSQKTCDCATGANCSETEKANCSSQKTCDCATGANCSETEKANCSNQKTCDCATGANCSETEKANCNIQTTCDCATKTNCSAEELANCNHQTTCDCSTEANCSAEELVACHANDKTCDCATGVDCDATALEACKTPGECGLGCAENETCLAHACIETTCIGVKCTNGLQCRDGSCVDVACDGMKCTDSRICQKGYCVDAKCQNVSCPDGQICNDDGKCVVQASSEILLQRASAVENVVTGSDRTVDYVFRLNAQPAEEVKVKLTFNKSNLIKANTQELIFTPENWQEPQKIMFSEADGNDLGTSQEVVAQFSLQSNDVAFNGVERTLGISFINTNYPHLVIRQESCAIDEGDIENFYIKLSSKPSAKVRVHVETILNVNNVVTYKPVSSSASLADNLWLEFDGMNWDTEQGVNVAVAENTTSNSYDSFEVKFTTDTTDENYKDLITDSLTYLVIDNDKPQLIANYAKVYTTDDGVDTEVCLHLNRADTQPVQVTMSVDSSSVSGETGQAKTVTNNADTCFKLHGEIDDIVDEDENYHITFVPADNGGDFKPDTATLVLEAVNRNTNVADMYLGLYPDDFEHSVNEEMGAFFYIVGTTSKPSAPVTVTATIPDEYKSEYILTSSSYTFDPADWDGDNTKFRIMFGLGVINNPNLDNPNPRQRSVTFKFTSDDPNYDGIERTDYFYIDDDERLAAYLEKDFNILSESQSNDSFDVNVGLLFKPDQGSLPLRICSSNDKKLVIHDPEDFNTTSGCVTVDFNCGSTTNKCEPVNLKVSPVDNIEADGDKEVYLKVNVPNHTAIQKASEMVTIVDDEQASSNLLIECQNNNIINCGTTYCKVALMSAPTGTVNVDVAVESPNGFTLKRTDSLSFTSENWSSGELIAIEYQKDTTHNRAFKKNALVFTTHGAGKYNEVQTKHTIAFYPLCSEVYNSRVKGSESASSSGITLPPGSYRLQVEGGLGGGPTQFLYRGNGARGTYAEGVLKLTEATTVYPRIGYAGMSRYFYRVLDNCDEEKYNCGFQGSSSMALNGFGHDGGGESDIRIGTNDNAHRVIVGAGGNGAGQPYFYVSNFSILIELSQGSNDDIEWAKGTTPNWQSNGAKGWMKKEDKNTGALQTFIDSIMGRGVGGGAGGWSMGTSADCWPEDGNCGRGATGGTGFVWTKDTDVSATPDYKLDKKYHLTEVRGWGGESADHRTDYPDLGVKGEGDSADGVVKITALPRL